LKTAVLRAHHSSAVTHLHTFK